MDHARSLDRGLRCSGSSFRPGGQCASSSACGQGRRLNARLLDPVVGDSRRGSAAPAPCPGPRALAGTPQLCLPAEASACFASRPRRCVLRRCWLLPAAAAGPAGSCGFPRRGNRVRLLASPAVGLSLSVAVRGASGRDSGLGHALQLLHPKVLRPGPVLCRVVWTPPRSHLVRAPKSTDQRLCGSVPSLQTSIIRVAVRARRRPEAPFLARLQPEGLASPETQLRGSGRPPARQDLIFLTPPEGGARLSWPGCRHQAQRLLDSAHRPKAACSAQMTLPWFEQRYSPGVEDVVGWPHEDVLPEGMPPRLTGFQRAPPTSAPRLPEGSHAASACFTRPFCSPGSTRTVLAHGLPGTRIASGRHLSPDEPWCSAFWRRPSLSLVLPKGQSVLGRPFLTSTHLPAACPRARRLGRSLPVVRQFGFGCLESALAEARASSARFSRRRVFLQTPSIDFQPVPKGRSSIWERACSSAH